jgi:hypothetical protein
MKPANPRILTINGGSSSIKFALYQAGGPLERELYGKIDRIGLSGTNLTFNDPTRNSPDSQSFASFERKSAGNFLIDWRRAEWLRIGPGCGTPGGPRHETHRARARYAGIAG